jgi:hypothetical protein
VDDDEVVRAWASLPRRVYLDTSTLQTVYDYGEVIWDGVALELGSGCPVSPDLAWRHVADLRRARLAETPSSCLFH